MSNNIAVTESFALNLTMPDTIRGASVITSLTPERAIDLSDGAKSTPESRAHGLASVLALLAFGSISYKTNPWDGRKTKYGKALCAAFGKFPHIKVKHGGAMASADFLIWFQACAKLAHDSIAVRAAPKPSVSPFVTTTAQPDHVLSPAELRDASKLLFCNMDNGAVDAWEKSCKAYDQRAIDLRNAAKAKADNLDRMAADSKARYAAQGRDNVAKAQAFAELANALGIKLSAAQIKVLDSIQNPIKVAA